MDFVDPNTCLPVEVVVDAWHANATGVYSGYIASSSESTCGGGGDGGMVNSTGGGAMSGGGMSGSGSGSGSGASATSSVGVTSGADTAGSSIAGAADDDTTFLRGAYGSEYVLFSSGSSSHFDLDAHSSEGQLTLYSIVPGWCKVFFLSFMPEIAF